MSPSARARFEARANHIASLVITGLWLGLLLSGVGGNLWLVVLIVGYAAVLPLVNALFGEDEWEDSWTEADRETGSAPPVQSGDETASAKSALETLRQRYAAGELTDEQFERKLERLLEVETLEDAEGWKRDARPSRDQEGSAVRDLEHE